VLAAVLLGFGFVFAQLQGASAMLLRSSLARTQNPSLPNSTSSIVKEHERLSRSMCHFTMAAVKVIVSDYRNRIDSYYRHFLTGREDIFSRNDRFLTIFPSGIYIDNNI
jgi:hypothetical protein